MLNLNRLAWLKAGAPPRNVAEAALRARFAGGTSYEKTVGPAPIISISDAKAKPAKSLIVGMEPIQDLHGYDSPWPAGGGRNLLPPATNATMTGADVTITRNADGSLTFSGTASDAVAIDMIGASDGYTLPAGAYKFSNKGSNTSASGSGGSVYVRDVDNSVTLANISLSSVFTGGISFTLSTTTTIRFYTVIQSDSAVSGTLYPMISLSTNTDMDYAPYENLCPIIGWAGVTVDHSGADTSDPQTYPIVFPDTVYGGTVDIVTGEGTATHGIDNLGDLLWKKHSSLTNVFQADASVFPAWKTVQTGKVANAVCTAYKLVTSASGGVDSIDNSLAIGTGVSKNIYVHDSRFSDATDFQNAISGVMLCYELAEPIPFTISPQQIQLLKGSNTLWSDGDSLTLTYIGTQPAGLLGGGFGGGYNSPAEQDPKELTEPEATETDVPAEETPAEEGENNGE